MPTASGGTILDGTYVLTSTTFYGTPCAPEQDRDTWLICGSTWQTAQEHTMTGSPTTIDTYNANAMSAGTTLQLTVLCGLPSMMTLNYPYDATPTSLTLYTGGGADPMSGRVDIFTRQ